MLHELVTIDHAWVLRCRQSHSMSSTCSSVLDEYPSHLEGLIRSLDGEGEDFKGQILHLLTVGRESKRNMEVEGNMEGRG